MENLVVSGATSRCAIDPGSWSERRVFIAGHTGFTGRGSAFGLKALGAEVCGYALGGYLKLTRAYAVHTTVHCWYKAHAQGASRTEPETLMTQKIHSISNNQAGS